MDTTILLVAGLPCRQAKPSAHIVLALDRVVAGEAWYKEAAGQGGRQADAERAILRAMLRPWRQHPPGRRNPRPKAPAARAGGIAVCVHQRARRTDVGQELRHAIRAPR